MELYVIAGPNGAGKTTFARKFLPNYAHCKNFVGTLKPGITNRDKESNLRNALA